MKLLVAGATGMVGIGTSTAPTTLYSQSTRNLLAAMSAHGGGAEGRYRLSTEGPLRRGWSITAADLASALLDVAEWEDLGRQHVYVGN